jgi:hypothetical protein
MRALAIAGILLAASCSTSRQTAGAAPSAIAWTAPAELAAGGGQRGEWRQNESSYDYVDDGTVAFLRDGTLAVAWVDQRRKDVSLKTFRSDGATTATVDISRSPSVFSWLPRLATDGEHLYVLWQEIVFSGGSHGGEAFFTRSADAGATFDAPKNLSRSRNGDGKGRLDARTWSNGSLDLAVAPDGMLVAAWTEFDGPLWIAVSTDRGATFSAPRQIDGGARPARGPSLAISDDGVIAIAWTVGDDPAADLRIARSSDRAVTFSRPSIAAKTRGHSDAPKLAFDDSGTLHLVWSEARAARAGAATIQYTRSRDKGRTFQVARELSAPHLAERNTYPMLALDGDQLVVGWELGEATQAMSRGLGLTYSADGGVTFTRPTLVPHSADKGGGWNGSHQGQLMKKLALHDGVLAIAQSALAHGKHSRVWLLRGRLPLHVTAR